MLASSIADEPSALPFLNCLGYVVVLLRSDYNFLTWVHEKVPNFILNEQLFIKKPKQTASIQGIPNQES